MPTLRRYCRVSKYTVLECRIYLDNPADLNTWLLSPRYNILPRIFTSVKPLVLPKLLEQRDRERVKGKKAAAVKDVVVEDDFEISLFLTNSGTRHTVMTKRKNLRVAPPKILSNSSKLTGGGGGRSSATVEIRREPSEDSIRLTNIPMALIPTFVFPDGDQEDRGVESGSLETRRSTRTKSKKRKSPALSDGGRSDGDDGSDSDPYEPPSKRQRTPIVIIPDSPSDSLFAEDLEEGEGDDKKKLGLETEYEGFNIHSRILCLVVKRRGTTGRQAAAKTSMEAAGKGKIMEEWISMSQAIKDGDGIEVE